MSKSYRRTKEHSKTMSEVKKQQYKDPEYRKKYKQAMKIANNRPDYIATRCKTVLQIDNSGKIIKEFLSAKIAGQQLKGTVPSITPEKISKICKKKMDSPWSFTFRYKYNTPNNTKLS